MLPHTTKAQPRKLSLLSHRSLRGRHLILRLPARLPAGIAAELASKDGTTAAVEAAAVAKSALDDGEEPMAVAAEEAARACRVEVGEGALDELARRGLIVSDGEEGDVA